MDISQLLTAAGIAPGDLYTVSETAAILRCSIRTAQRLVQRGRVPAFRRGRRIIGITHAAIAAYLGGKNGGHE